MKISYSWLKLHLPKSYHRPADELAELLTDIGLEVEGVEAVETVKGGLRGLVIGAVLETKQHPNADRLKLCRVDIGADEPLSIVCGAPNVEANQKVVVATVGATLYPSEGEPFRIKKSKIRGEASMGMICAEDEIGLGDSHDGIMVLPENAPVGQPAADYFDVSSDYCIEIGLTPNRADAMSHRGVARDIVGALNARENKQEQLVDLPEVKHQPAQKSPISVEVLDREKCPRYAGVLLQGLTVKESPAWFRNYLQIIGVKPINNVVDVTNYILHDLGQPLHAFDYDNIAGNIVRVQTLPEKTPFVTLDEEERKLDAQDLMICDARQGMCIAGVFGGIHSGVTESTQSIFLESAYFQPVSVRKTAKRHGLNTDASFRFERGIDPNGVIVALHRAVQLIQELAGGEIASPFIDQYPEPIADFAVNFSPNRCRMLVGTDISDDEMKRILHALDIEVESEGNNWQLRVPAYRVDVQREADIVEEVLRIYGFNRVPIPEKMNFTMATQRTPEPFKIQEKVSAFLAANGFMEAMSNSLTAATMSKINGKMAEPVEMLNPLSSDLNVLRSDMLITGLENVAYNLNRQQKNIRLFEFGHVYYKSEDGYHEPAHLALWLSGTAGDRDWRENERKMSFYDLKALLYRLFSSYELEQAVEWQEYDLLPYQEGLAGFVNQKQLLSVGVLSPEVLKKWDIDAEVLYADIRWDEMLKWIGEQSPEFREIPRYPEMRRDLSLLIDEQIRYEDIEKLARKQDQKILQEVGLFDVYTGKNLPSGKKSYALYFTFRDANKTLKDKQVDKVMDRIISEVKREFSAELR